LDKWLWAARFFKTRALAAAAIEGGKVELNGDRAKRAKTVRPGDRIAVRLGPYEHLVTVLGISERRGSAALAQALYLEDEEAKKRREFLALQLKAQAPLFRDGAGRPTKKDRRTLNRLKGR
jgi:ribosome-associated heat shock protein Hsp15